MSHVVSTDPSRKKRPGQNPRLDVPIGNNYVFYSSNNNKNSGDVYYTEINTGSSNEGKSSCCQWNSSPPRDSLKPFSHLNFDQAYRQLILTGINILWIWLWYEVPLHTKLKRKKKNINEKRKNPLSKDKFYLLKKYGAETQTHFTWYFIISSQDPPQYHKPIAFNLPRRMTKWEKYRTCSGGTVEPIPKRCYLIIPFTVQRV